MDELTDKGFVNVYYYVIYKKTLQTACYDDYESIKNIKDAIIVVVQKSAFVRFYKTEGGK